MLSTEECHLGKVQQRNPGLSRRDMEQAFADYLGIEKVIWLGCGIKGDDTHGHVDDISRFVAADTVLTAVERTVATPTANRCGKIFAGCALPPTFTDASFRSSNFRCPALSSSRGNGCRQLCQLLYC